MQTPRSARGHHPDEGAKLALLESCRGEANVVIPGRLYVGDIATASNASELLSLGILHVINCGVLGQSDSASDGVTKSVLHLHDTPHEDIGPFLYQVLDAVGFGCSDASTAGVLLHCEKGVSRSCAFAAACVMYAEDIDVAEALAKVTTARPVCDPNIGFHCQLVEWHKRRHMWMEQHEEQGRAVAWRMAVDRQDPGPRQRLVPKLCLDPATRRMLPISRALLDSRTTFIIVPDLKSLPLVHWVGSEAPAASITSAKKLLKQLRRYEGLGDQWPACQVNEAESEPAWFVEALARWGEMAGPSVVFDDIAEVANVPPMEDLLHVTQHRLANLPSIGQSLPHWACSSPVDGGGTGKAVDVSIEPEPEEAAAGILVLGCIPGCRQSCVVSI